MQKSFLFVSRTISQRLCRSSAIPIKQHSSSPRVHRVESSLKGRGWMEEGRLVGEKGGGIIGQISSGTTDYSMAIALVSGKEEGTCVFRYNFSSSHPVPAILRHRDNVRLDLKFPVRKGFLAYDEVCIKTNAEINLEKN